MFETDIHYPTDINLLLDAIRKVIILSARLSGQIGMSDWRQSDYNFRKAKRLYRKIQKMKRSSSKADKKKKAQDALIKEAHQIYLSVVGAYLDKAETTLESLEEGLSLEIALKEIREYIVHDRRQIDQIKTPRTQR